MQTPLISPNLHVILIHYPLALLIGGVMIELFSFMWPRSGFRAAGRWMILLGALSAIVAAYSGIYALRDVAHVDEDMPWLRFKIDSPVFRDPKVWMTLWNHTLYQSIGAVASALVVVVWLGCSDRSRERLRWPLLIILLWTLAVIVRAAWFGGESVYRHGVAVEAVYPRLAEKESSTTQPETWSTSPTKAEQLFPPLELHIIGAGVATAIALAAIGLSFRRLTTLYEAPTHRPITARDETMAPRTPPSAPSVARTLNPDITIDLHFSAPAGRFWMLAFFVALLTGVGGMLVLARGASIPLDQWQQPKVIAHLLREQIQPEDWKKPTRIFAHFVTGSVIVAMPLLMALLARFAPRERIVLSICTLILLTAVTAQLWFGVLLLYDTSDGPLRSFITAKQ